MCYNYNMRYHSIFLLGIPVKRSDRQAYEQAIKDRHGGDLEKAISYVQSAADRQITKASGILSSSSLLAGLSYFTEARVPLIMILMAILLSLTSFYSKWASSVNSFNNPEEDFERVVHVCYNRSLANNLSTFLLFISVIILATNIIFKV